MDDMIQLAGDELLHRQVVPSWRYEDGTPMSVNFQPRRPNDGGLLSTRQASLMSAEEAYKEHVAEGWQSAGTWSFTGAEAQLPVIDDSASEDAPRAHASVDFRQLSNREKEKAASRIKQAAVSRGCQFRAPS